MIDDHSYYFLLREQDEYFLFMYHIFGYISHLFRNIDISLLQMRKLRFRKVKSCMLLGRRKEGMV